MIFSEGEDQASNVIMLLEGRESLHVSKDLHNHHIGEKNKIFKKKNLISIMVWT